MVWIIITFHINHICNYLSCLNHRLNYIIEWGPRFDFTLSVLLSSNVSATRSSLHWLFNDGYTNIHETQIITSLSQCAAQSLATCLRGHCLQMCGNQGSVSISDKTYYRKISWSLDAARFVFRIVRQLWNLTGTSAALLPTWLSNFTAIRYFKLPISRLRDFTRSYDNASYRILKRGPEF